MAESFDPAATSVAAADVAIDAPETTAESQRARLVDAMASLCLEVGYPNVKVGDVTSRAKVAKRTFYVHFTDKEDCFLAVYEEIDAELRSAIFGATVGYDDPLIRLQRAMAALLEVFAERPEYAVVYLVEAATAGPRVSARQLEATGDFADLYLALHAAVAPPDSPPMSRARAFAAVGAIWFPIEMVYREEGAAALPALADEISQAVYAIVYPAS